MDLDEAHRRAETLFKKEQQLREGQQAMAEYQAELRAMRERTARLRALRLARDAATEKAARQPEGRGVTRPGIPSPRAVMSKHRRGQPKAASVANSIDSIIEGSSFSGLLTRVEIGHIRIRPAGNGRVSFWK